MMAPVSAKLFIAQAALPVLLLHGSVLPMQDFQGLAAIRTCHVNTAKYSWCTQRSVHMQSAAGCYRDTSVYFATVMHVLSYECAH